MGVCAPLAREDAVLLGGPLGAHGELASPSGGILPVTTASGGP